MILAILTIQKDLTGRPRPLSGAGRSKSRVDNASGPARQPWPRTGHGPKLLLALLSAPRPHPNTLMEGIPKNYTFIYFITFYYILLHSITFYRHPFPLFYGLPLHPYYTLSRSSRTVAVTHSRPLALNVYECFPLNLIAPPSVYIRACRRADML
jgi:hypothetical protein